MFNVNVRKIWALLLVLIAVGVPSKGVMCFEVPSPTADDSLAVDIINSVVRVFEHEDTPLWNGYDLSTQEILIYSPGRWAMLLNHNEPISNYTAYPSHWPDLSVPALIRWGEIEELAGQLYFNYEVGADKTVAIPIYTEVPDELGPMPLVMFAFIVHEAFHQFQRKVFRDMESFSEEKYPILDIENNALVALEMHILQDAVRQVGIGNINEVRHFAEIFVAVRESRWERAAPIVRAVERAKEIQEGSAEYVEARYIGIMAELCRSGEITRSGMRSHFSSLNVTKYLENDFKDRLEGNALRPQDIPRNRIYPVGATIFVLLDFLNVRWQGRVEEGREGFTPAGLLREFLGISTSDMGRLLEEAKKQYDFDGIAAASRNLIEEYNREFEDALAAFSAQPGFRVELEVPSSGLLRSRSSRGTRWTAQGGNKVFGEKYIVYTLRRQDPEFFLKVENTGVLEELVEDTMKRVSFFVPALIEARVDGNALDLGVPGRRSFQDLIVTGDGLRITAKGRGIMMILENGVSVHLENPQN